MMRIIFMGTPEFSLQVLQELVTAGHDIAAVYTQPPRKAGRGKNLRPSPVEEWAREAGLDVRHPVNFKAPSDRKLFADLDADVAVVVAYGLILPQELLDAPARGCLNIHASPLPRWRGAAPIQRAIMAGDAETGICIMQMDAGLDTGPVLARASTNITNADTAETLHDRLANIGAKLICSTLDNIDTLHPEQQSGDGVTYAAKISKSETKIDWSRPAEDVDRHIRGISPYPGAWFEAEGARIKVLASNVSTATGVSGTVLDENLTVACGTRSVRLLRLQKAGKRPQDIDDFILGTKIPVGTRLD